MSYYELQDLKQKVKLILQGQAFTLQHEALEVDLYTEGDISVLCCGTHHLTITIKSILKEKILTQKLIRVLEILESVRVLGDFNKKYLLIYLNNDSSEFGYLGPIISETLFSGIQCTFKLRVCSTDLKALESLCVQYKYQLYDRSRSHRNYTLEQETIKESKPLLSDHDTEKKLITSDRPSFLPIEYRFMNDLGKLFHK